MTDKEKYVFRLYNIGVPNQKAIDTIGSDIEGKTFLGSPYITHGSNILDVNSYKVTDKPIYDSQFDDIRYERAKDELARPESNRAKFKDGNHSFDEHGNLILPHKGISVISLADPQFSLYDPFDFGDSFVQYNDDGKPYINKKFIESVGEDYEYPIDKRIKEFLGPNYSLKKIINSDDNIIIDDKDLDDALKRTPKHFPRFEDKKALIGTLNKYIMDLLAQDFFDPIFTASENFHIKNAKDLSTYDFGYSKPHMDIVSHVDADGNTYKNTSRYHRGLPYEQLLRRIWETWLITNANGLVLATVPESAFYNVKDVIDGKLRAQRDYPEELVVRQLTPRKIFSVQDKTWARPEHMSNILGVGKYKQGSKNHIDLNHIFRLLEKGYADGGTPEEVNALAKKIIHYTFDIDPINISDENKKFIFDDLSNWYKGYSAKKESKHKSIINGIKELGQ